MDAADEKLPFFSRHSNRSVFAIRFASTAGAAIDESAGIARVVQNLDDSTMVSLTPKQFSFLRARPNPAWKPKFLVAKIPDRLHC
jgi:hypothetical protein